MAFGDRKHPLRSDPAKTRAWHDRHRGSLQRGMDAVRRAPLKPGKRKPRLRIPHAIRQEVYARTEGACAVCAYREGVDPFALAASGLVRAELRRMVRTRRIRKAAHLHHVLAQQRWPELALEPWNMIGLCASCHMNHEGGVTRVPLGALWAATRNLASTVMGGEDYLKRTYSDDEPGPRRGGTAQ